jgi:hypothetical protein
VVQIAAAQIEVVIAVVGVSDAVADVIVEAAHKAVRADAISRPPNTLPRKAAANLAATSLVAATKTVAATSAVQKIAAASRAVSNLADPRNVASTIAPRKPRVPAAPRRQPTPKKPFFYPASPSPNIAASLSLLLRRLP